METVQVVEILLRGAAAGFNLLLAITFLRTRNSRWAGRLGGAFALCVAAYALVSSDLIAAALGPAAWPLVALSVPASLFHWWFALALFDDGFRWRWWHFPPVAAIGACSGTYFLSVPASTLFLQALTLWQIVVGLLMAHAALMALRDWRDDLIEPRRRFRVFLASMTGLTGLILVIVELIFVNDSMPDNLFLLQAVVLFVLSLTVTIWTSVFRHDLLERPEQPIGIDIPAGIEPEDRALTRRLKTAISDGVLCEANLTVGGLAERLSTSEHRLRKLINQGLGYRNFSSFLNAHRLEVAKTVLADPERARDQILLLALDLGYGSIAPFNRAFKAATGQTPTAYRREMLRR